jgi:long-chain acyl-CoA synthetase
MGARGRSSRLVLSRFVLFCLISSWNGQCSKYNPNLMMDMKLPFFPLKEWGDHIALIDGDRQRSTTYADLVQFQENLSTLLPPQRHLAFIFCENRESEVAAYLTAINRGDVVCLMDGRLDEEMKRSLIQCYEPESIMSSKGPSYPDYDRQELFDRELILWRRHNLEQKYTLHPQLQLLLSTSGTTGSPKMIRLSRDNLWSNAMAIKAYLEIGSDERAMASLPIHYSYGLSVLHTHLLSGASLVLTQSSVVQAPFWQLMRQYQCTSLAGVPYTYALLDRVGFDPAEFPDLRTLTQAGGGLEKELVLKFFYTMQRKGGHFYVMYGQTEATARIAYLPPLWLPTKVGSIGQAIPGGILQILDDQQLVSSPYVEGELVYQGLNVMMGYAECRQDLERGDENQGILHTGDLGYFDEDGLFYVTGRLKRISKVFGYRINLDEIETLLRPYAQVAATTDDRQIYLYFEQGDSALFEQCIQQLSHRYHLHPTIFVCQQLSSFPRTAVGKIDYPKLQERGDECS